MGVVFQGPNTLLRLSSSKERLSRGGEGRAWFGCFPRGSRSRLPEHHREKLERRSTAAAPLPSSASDSAQHTATDEALGLALQLSGFEETCGAFGKMKLCRVQGRRVSAKLPPGFSSLPTGVPGPVLVPRGWEGYLRWEERGRKGQGGPAISHGPLKGPLGSRKVGRKLRELHLRVEVPSPFPKPPRSPARAGHSRHWNLLSEAQLYGKKEEENPHSENFKKNFIRLVYFNGNFSLYPTPFKNAKLHTCSHLKGATSLVNINWARAISTQEPTILQIRNCPKKKKPLC